MPELSPNGSLRNCSAWASWESMGSSPTANLCHGGLHGEEHYTPCQARHECREATLNKDAHARTNRTLPVLPNGRGFTPVAPTPIGALPPRPGYPQPAPYPQQSAQYPRPGMPTSLQQAQPQKFNYASAPGHSPVPVIPPLEYPAAMRTPYVHHPTQLMGVTPTFLPEGDESMLARLCKNAIQGAIGSTGWHVFSFMNSVDIFKR